MNHLLSFFGSFGLTLLLTWYVRGAALTNNWVSVPRSYRHVHNRPIPRLGGIAIVLAFFGITGALAIVNQIISPHVGFSSHRWLALLGPTLLIFALGLYDDIKNTSPFLKLGVEIVAAVWLFADGYRVTYAFGGRHLGFSLSLALTVSFVVLITNAFNLIDGIDGLAAGSALFSALVIFVIALLNGSYFVSLTSVALLGCILAFLRYNFHPATIFLGDSGSLFIGFVLSALGLASGQASPTLIAVAIPVVACGLPILETGLSVLRRFMNDKPLFTADRDHIHHKLLAMGLSQRQVAIMLYAVSALFAGISLLLLSGGSKSVTLALGIVGAVVWIALQRVGYLEMSELQRVAQRTMEQKRIMANNLCIRRACETLKTCSSITEMCTIFETAFEKNEFDRIELRFPMPADMDREVNVAPMTIDRGHVVYF
ncbi:MAG: undecaprenyl/decaprenyl-phosphate alpha-N-acetylglucosaminyl 1-phosphate transferase, partial [Acidobacteriota bacterium]|nr:undecaprenyl/decaprenyl-phosphate alpha-N-acetylglucosaminyl 1-phosphate transferase [Acidobacteriota bacterium]